MIDRPLGPILLIGAGKMGGALLKGWRRKNVGQITVVDPGLTSDLIFFLKSERDKELHHVRTVGQLANYRKKGSHLFQACIVAVKPQVLKEQASALRFIARSGTLMISIAAGTHSETLQRAWGKEARIIRAMPNTPGAIGHGITGLYAVKGTRAKDRRLANDLLSALGKTIWVDREEHIDIVTAVSGSGPAYLFLMVEVLTRAGVIEGLPYETARELARATVAGSGYLLEEDKRAARTLRRNVTSPGGTTEAALRVLMKKTGLAHLMAEAVHAARKRAEELR